MSYKNITPEEIHDMAAAFKGRMRKDLPDDQAELGEMLVDCFAALLVKLALTEYHLESIAHSQKFLSGRE